MTKSETKPTNQLPEEENAEMTKPETNPVPQEAENADKLKLVTPEAAPDGISSEIAAELEEEEAEFRAIRRDLPGVKGTSATGIVAISVGKAPPKNEFFRCHKVFHPVIPMVNCEIGMEKAFFAVASNMIEPLAGIGIMVTEHTLYLSVTPQGSFRVVPVRCANAEGERNSYDSTKEIGMTRALTEWVRLYTDNENRCYKVFCAPKERFAEPSWPELSPAKIFRLAFRDKGRLIDNSEHPLFQKWAARDTKEPAARDTKQSAL